MTTPYRDTLDVVRAELAVARAHRATEITISRALIPVLARRMARSLFGWVLILAATVLILEALSQPREGTLTSILIVSLPISIATGLVTRPLLRRVLERGPRSQAARHHVDRRPGFTEEDPHACLDALNAEPCGATALALRVASWEGPGLTLPLIGLTVILPLSLHLVVWAVIQLTDHIGGLRHASYWSDLGKFDGWIMASMILVGMAHLALVVCVFVHVGTLRRSTPFQPPSVLTPLAVAVAAAAFPGVVFLSYSPAALLPVVFAFVTGVVFIPALFGRAATVFREERALIDDVERSLARASARRRPAGGIRTPTRAG